MATKKLYFYSFGVDEKAMSLDVSVDCVDVRETPRCYKTLCSNNTLPKRYSDQMLKAEVGGKVTSSSIKLVLGCDYQVVLEEDNIEKAIRMIRNILCSKLSYYKNKVCAYEYMVNRLSAWGD